MIKLVGLPSLAMMGMVLLFMAGCAASETMISKRNLEVQTKMSETIFLDPVAENKKVIFVQVRNTSDKKDFNLEAPIKKAMEERGYTITTDPDKAHYRLQANVLQIGKSDVQGAQAALQSGYGGTNSEGQLAVKGINAATAGWKGDAVSSFAGSALEGLTQATGRALVKDVYFLLVTDVQVVEKAADGVIIRQDSQRDSAHGMAGTQQQVSSEVTNLKKYRTRVVSTANKANLEYEEAAPELTKGLTNALAGLF
ncbi:MAG: complement resistance protein TraT [Nitrospira sp.]